MSTPPNRTRFTAGAELGQRLDQEQELHAHDPYVHTLGVGGYRTLEFSDGSPVKVGHCTLEIEIAPTALLTVHTDAPPDTTAEPDPCTDAQRVARVILGQLGAGNP